MNDSQAVTPLYPQVGQMMQLLNPLLLQPEEDAANESFLGYMETSKEAIKAAADTNRHLTQENEQLKGENRELRALISTQKDSLKAQMEMIRNLAPISNRERQEYVLAADPKNSATIVNLHNQNTQELKSFFTQIMTHMGKESEGQKALINEIKTLQTSSINFQKEIDQLLKQSLIAELKDLFDEIDLFSTREGKTLSQMQPERAQKLLSELSKWIVNPPHSNLLNGFPAEPAEGNSPYTHKKLTASEWESLEESIGHLQKKYHLPIRQDSSFPLFNIYGLVDLNLLNQILERYLKLRKAFRENGEIVDKPLVQHIDQVIYLFETSVKQPQYIIESIIYTACSMHQKAIVEIVETASKQIESLSQKKGMQEKVYSSLIANERTPFKIALKQMDAIFWLLYSYAKFSNLNEYYLAKIRTEYPSKKYLSFFENREYLLTISQNSKIMSTFPSNVCFDTTDSDRYALFNEIKRIWSRPFANDFLLKELNQKINDLKLLHTGSPQIQSIPLQVDNLERSLKEKNQKLEALKARMESLSKEFAELKNKQNS